MLVVHTNCSYISLRFYMHYIIINICLLPGKVLLIVKHIMLHYYVYALASEGTIYGVRIASITYGYTHFKLNEFPLLHVNPEHVYCVIQYSTRYAYGGILPFWILCTPFLCIHVRYKSLIPNKKIFKLCTSVCT